MPDRGAEYQQVIVGSSTLSYFYPTLIAGLFGNSSTERTNFLTIPIYGAAFVCTLITSYFGDKVPAWRGLIIAAWLTFSLACSIAVCTVYDYTARYALLVLMAGPVDNQRRHTGLCFICLFQHASSDKRCKSCAGKRAGKSGPDIWFGKHSSI